MFKFLFRKTSLRGCCEEDIKKVMLLKDQYKIRVLVGIAVIFMMLFPLLTVYGLNMYIIPHTRRNEIILITYCLIYAIAFILICKRFIGIILKFEELITADIYTSLYTFKGKALSKKDFDIIKERNEKLHWQIVTMQGCKGWCYTTSFQILKALKKGTMKFFAIEKLQLEDDEKEKYTIHVVYENNGWCFDTYSHKQYPLDEFMKIWKGKEYKTFTYEDIKDLTFEKFKEKELPELEEFCKQNDCCQNMKKHKIENEAS